MALKQTDAVLKAWLDLVVDAGGPYDPAALFLGVATAVNDLGAATVLADITQATGAMATRVAIVAWGASYKLADGRWVCDGTLAVFSPLNSTEQQALTHWFLVSAAAAGTLKAFAPFGQTYNMVDENRQLTIIPRLTIDPQGRFSAEIVFNG